MGGAALVALSGVVPAPQPLMQQAHAATTTLTVNGTFISGITIQTAVDPDLGTIIATAITGTAKIQPSNNVGGSNSTIIGGSANGKIKAKYKAAKPVDVKVTGFGTLGPTVTNATLTKLYFTGVFTGTVTGGMGTPTATTTGLALTGAGNSKVANVGAGVGWTGAFPKVGTFGKTINVILTY